MHPTLYEVSVGMHRFYGKIVSFVAKSLRTKITEDAGINYAATPKILAINLTRFGTALSTPLICP
ncbi:hypothetical protein [Chroococcidiopsis sp. CCMEE 29]|uniref:hypothetical protein n=1 Tax=Chroococcidiopsis sp. CCMEE 29 TaxID=155894 RepID=UPI002021B822|nr:hypothetical protein [Chroococcidiopsis sp. CCMEE 29]